LFEFDLVAAITGASFGDTNLISRIVYGLVGLAAIWLIPSLPRVASEQTAPAH
jgi:uncharacterized membrane protein YuzA (DUF378 family)